MSAPVAGKEVRMRDNAVETDFLSLTGNEVKIGVIDSGIDAFHPDLKRVVGGIAIRLDGDGRLAFSDDYQDVIGHGTACAGIIHKKAPGAWLYSIKIFENELCTSPQILIEAIRWAMDHGINVLNLSLGTTDRDQITPLRGICQQACEKGVILVSAEHAEGKESYPAVFPEVIGVAGGSIRGKYAYLYREAHPIEFVARGDPQRLAWVNPRYVFMGGSSFAAPHITGIVALILERYPSADLQEVKRLLVEHAGGREQGRGRRSIPDSTVQSKIHRGAQSHKATAKFPWIKKAVIYPYNKEMHALIRFRDLLHFEIVGVVDPVGKRLVGKDAGEVIGMEPVGLRITHKLGEALSNADTLILGYVNELGRISNRDVLYHTIDHAVTWGKNVFTFVSPEMGARRSLKERAVKQELHFHVPEVTGDELDRVHFPSDPQVEVPVVGVFGTSPQQGKFTTQLALRRMLLREGYKVGQIGTEHHSELFGFDLSFPIGYSCSVEIPLEAYIPYLEAKLWEIAEQSDPDIIIVGAQSGIVPHDFAERSPMYTLPSICFLLGTKPDAYILAVNSIDEDEYIQDSIHALEAIGKGKTILLTMSDKQKDVRSAYGVSRVIHTQRSPEELAAQLARLEDTFGLPATEVVSEQGQGKLLDTVVDYFAEG